MDKKKKEMTQPAVEDKSNLDILTEDGFFSEAIGSLVQDNFAKMFGQRDIVTIFGNLKSEGKKINEGNLKSAEKMLIVQAQTLNTVFNSLAYRAGKQDTLHLLESLMRLAFKAQSQCRATLETLANIKNPPNVAFVKQANIGHNQQVNNAASAPDKSSRAVEIKNQQNQLLEDNHGKRLDIGAKSTSISSDKELETMGKVYGAQKHCRESKSSDEGV